MADSTRERDGIRKVEGKLGTRWQAKVNVKGYKPRYKTFIKKTDARRWQMSERAAMIERRHFAYAEADKHTMADMIDRFIKHKKPSQTRTHHLDFWKEILGTRILSDISSPDIAEARDILAAKVTRLGTPFQPGTVNRHLNSLSVVYGIARKEWKWVQSNPVKDVDKLSEPRGRVRYLSESEITALLNACKLSNSANLYPMVLLALSCGARAGELLDLRWPDVDLVRGRATLHNTKNRERRFISIKGKARDVLKEHGKVKRIDTDRVFPSVDGIRRYRYSVPFNKAVKDAEIQDFRFHDLRHTCASYLAMNGASAIDIAAVLGHKTLSMTHRYSHLADSHVDDVVERMNAKVLGGE